MQLIQRYKAKYGEEKGVDGLQQSGISKENSMKLSVSEKNP